MKWIRFLKSFAEAIINPPTSINTQSSKHQAIPEPHHAKAVGMISTIVKPNLYLPPQQVSFDKTLTMLRDYILEL